jgi:terminase small subunit-like protein
MNVATNEQRWKVAHHHTDGVEAGQIFARVKPRLVVFSHGGSPESLPLVRQNYDGPVEIGEDMMTIDVGDTMLVRRRKWSANGRSARASARVVASRLLTKANIAAEVEAALEDRRRRTEATADNVIKELTRIAFFDIGVLFDERGRLRPVTGARAPDAPSRYAGRGRRGPTDAGARVRAARRHTRRVRSLN